MFGAKDFCRHAFEFDSMSVAVAQAYLTRSPEGSGVCNEGPPWLAMPVKSRIGALQAQWQQAEKLHRTEGPVVYEALAKELYGRLRETWERAVEEVLLNGAVVRFRRGVTGPGRPARRRGAAR